MMGRIMAGSPTSFLNIVCDIVSQRLPAAKKMGAKAPILLFSGVIRRRADSSYSALAPYER